MTKPELAGDEAPFSAKRYITHIVLWSVGLSFALIGAVVGAIAGKNYLTEGAASDLVIALIAAPLTLAASYGLWRTMPDFTMGEPHTPRGNRVRWLVVGVLVLGLAISVPILLADPERGGQILWSNDPIPPTPALIAVLMWGLTIPIVIVAGRRVADEHTRAANDFGMMVGFQTFAYLAPLWWMGWRGGFLPQPDVMILFIIAGTLSSAANLWKRLA